jgi:hypothetical protein
MRSLPGPGAGWPLHPDLDTATAGAPDIGRPSLRRLRAWLTADRRTVAVLSILMLGNALFALLHAFRFLLLYLGHEPGGLLTHDRLSLGFEWGYAEIFNYLQTLALVGFLAAIASRTHQALYLSWAAVFLLVAIDEALAIHQQFGSLMAAVMPLPPSFGLRPASLSETAAWLGGAMGLVALVAFGVRRAAPAHREIGWYFAWLFGLLVVFGVGVDLLHSLLRGTFFGISLVLEVVEEGGEMVSISLACALAFAVWRAIDHVSPEGTRPGPADAADDGPMLDRIRRHGGL